MDSRLSPLQSDLLRAFFRREQRFHLTGGAALAGYHLGHRTTADLDLFTSDTSLDEGESALREAAREVGGEIEALRTAPTFRRRLVRRGGDAVVVDLVLDPTPQGWPEKLRFGEVRVDPPEEILANKLCALLSRAEIRDLVDVLALDRAGFRVEDALGLAQRKDGGLTPAQLGWVLSQIQIGTDARVSGATSASELREFLIELQRRFAHVARPT